MRAGGTLTGSPVWQAFAALVLLCTLLLAGAAPIPACRSVRETDLD
jgi:hypothetical protein